MKRLSWLYIAASVAVLALPAAAQPVTVIVNGQPMTFAQPPIERAGRVFVPLRGIFEQLGASVVYQNGQINATAHRRTVSLTIGSTQAVVAGQPTTLDVAPFIVGSTTFVPLRFISQALGASVSWNDSNSTVTIVSHGRPGPPPAPAPPPPPRHRGIYLTAQSPTGTIYDPSPTLRFTFNRPISLDGVTVWIDGRQILQGAFRQNGPSSYACDVPWLLPWGPHRVRIAGEGLNGQSFDQSWGFVTVEH